MEDEFGVEKPFGAPQLSDGVVEFAVDAFEAALMVGDGGSCKDL